MGTNRDEQVTKHHLAIIFCKHCAAEQEPIALGEASAIVCRKCRTEIRICGCENDKLNIDYSGHGDYAMAAKILSDKIAKMTKQSRWVTHGKKK